MANTRIKYNQLKEIPGKKPCKVATTDNISNLLTGAPNIVDGVSLSVNDRVLVKSQTTASQNGVYEVVSVGTGADGVWQRSTDLSTNDDIYDGISLFINSGTANGNSLWYLNTPDPITLDTTSLTFSQFQSGGADGNGIYDGSGTVPTSTIATTTDNISFLGPAVGSGGGFYVGTSSGSARLHVLDVDTQMQLSYDSSHFTTVHHDNADLLFFKNSTTAEDVETRFLSGASSVSYRIRFGYGNSLNNAWSIVAFNTGKPNFRIVAPNGVFTDPVMDIQTNGSTKLGMNSTSGNDVAIGISASGSIGARLDVFTTNTTTGNILRLRNGDLNPVFSVRGDGNLYAYSTTVSEIQSGGVSDFTKGWLYLTNTEATLGFNVVGGFTKNGAYFTDSISSLQFDNKYVFKSEGSTTLVGGPSGSSIDPHIEFSHNLLSSTASADSGYIKVTDNLGSKGIIYDGDYTANFTTYSLVTKGYVDSSSTNFANTDLTFNGSRIHNTNNNDFTLTSNLSYTDAYIYLQSGTSSNQLVQLHKNTNTVDVLNNGVSLTYNFVSGLFLSNGLLSLNEDKGFDVRIKSVSDDNLFYSDETANAIGVGTASPLYRLHVIGTVSTTGFRMTDGAQDGYVLTSDASGNATWQVGGGDTTTQTTGLTISFTSKQIYNTPASPGTGNVTDDLTGAQLGVVQKIYHNSGTAPTFPAGWVLLGDGIYFTSQLNIIYAEWVTGTRVEYWIIQEQ